MKWYSKAHRWLLPRKLFPTFKENFKTSKTSTTTVDVTLCQEQKVTVAACRFHWLSMKELQSIGMIRWISQKTTIEKIKPTNFKKKGMKCYHQLCEKKIYIRKQKKKEDQFYLTILNKAVVKHRILLGLFFCIYVVKYLTQDAWHTFKVDCHWLVDVHVSAFV